MAKPSLKTPEVVATICAKLSEGVPLAVICREEGMPSHVTVWNWRQDDAALSEAIARAREIGFDAIASDALDIADTKTDDPQCRRVRIDTRLKLLAKWDPKRYGDKVQTEHTGSVALVAASPVDEAL